VTFIVHLGQCKATSSTPTAMPSSIKLKYFDFEGVAEPTRLALTLAGVEFEDVRVKFPEWKDMKATTPYGQLPLLEVDGGEARTQSGAMLRWAGGLNPEKGLYPSDKLYEIEEAIGLVQDMQKSWSPFIYIAMAPTRLGHPEGFGQSDADKATIAELRKKWIDKNLPTYLGYIADMIDKHGGKWIAADGPTIADCFCVPALRSFTKGHIDHVDPNCLDINPKIVDYIKRFCALPEIKGRYTDGINEN